MALHHVCLPNAPCQLLRFGAQEPRALNQPTCAASIAGQPDPGPTQETEDQAGSEQGKVVGFVRFGTLNHLGLRLFGCDLGVSAVSWCLPLPSGTQSAWHWAALCQVERGLLMAWMRLGLGAISWVMLGPSRTYFGSFRLSVWAWQDMWRHWWETYLV